MTRHRLTAILCAGIVVGLAAPGIAPSPASAAQGRPGLFATVEIASEDLSALPQWVSVLDRLKVDADATALCDRAVEACVSMKMTVWRAKIQELEGRGLMTQLWEVNRFINTWPMRRDEEAYGAEDYWASPIEFLANGGDSEDFAIIKYATLRQLGIADRNLRIVVARDSLRNRIHSVLAVYADGEIYIMDSVNNTVLKHEIIKYYVPYYSLNETTRWAHMPLRAVRAP